MVHGRAEGIGHVQYIGILELCLAWFMMPLAMDLKVLSGRLGVHTLANYLIKKPGSLGLIDAFLFLNLGSGSVQPSRTVFLSLISSDR